MNIKLPVDFFPIVSSLNRNIANSKVRCEAAFTWMHVPFPVRPQDLRS